MLDVERMIMMRQRQSWIIMCNLPLRYDRYCLSASCLGATASISEQSITDKKKTPRNQSGCFLRFDSILSRRLVLGTIL